MAIAGQVWAVPAASSVALSCYDGTTTYNYSLTTAAYEDPPYNTILWNVGTGKGGYIVWIYTYYSGFYGYSLGVADTSGQIRWDYPGSGVPFNFVNWRAGTFGELAVIPSLGLAVCQFTGAGVDNWGYLR